MRVLLDACIDPRVAGLLEEHHVSTAFDLGWQSLPDHELMRRIQDRFEVFITLDRGFEHEHNLSKIRFGIIIVHIPRNKAVYYRSLLPALIAGIAAIHHGQVLHVR